MKDFLELFENFYDTLEQPFWLWLLVLLAPLIALRLWSHIVGFKKLKGLVAARLASQLIEKTNQSRRWMSFTFMMLAIVCLIIALARPKWGTEVVPSFAEGRSLIIAIDTSRSMLANDVSPNRLERTKLAVRDVIDQLNEDRVGIIAFAGKAFMQAPLTNDREAIFEVIDQLDTDIIPRGGTNLVEPVMLALEAFKEEEAKQSALVIFSDGEALEGNRQINQIRELAKKENLAIITIGVGTVEGALIQLPDGQFVCDETGNQVVSKLDSSALRALTNESGFYLQLGSRQSMRRVVELIKANLEVTRGEQLSEERELEQFGWPLSIAIIFFIFAHLGHLLYQSDGKHVSVTRTRGGPAIVLIYLLICNQSIALDRSAWKYLAREDYTLAKEKLLSNLEGKRMSKRIEAHTLLALGVTYYRIGDFENAINSFGKALIYPDDKVREQAHYNLGNSLVRRGELILNPDRDKPDGVQLITDDPKRRQATIVQWLGAIEHYEATGRLNVKNVDARHNVEILKKRIDQLRKDTAENPEGEGSQNQNNSDQDPNEQQSDKNNESSSSSSNQSNQTQNQDDEDHENHSDNDQQSEDKNDIADQSQDKRNEDGQSQEEAASQFDQNGAIEDSKTIKASIKNATTGYSPSEARQIIENLSGDQKLQPIFPQNSDKERFRDW